MTKTKNMYKTDGVEGWVVETAAQEYPIKIPASKTVSRKKNINP